MMAKPPSLYLTWFRNWMNVQLAYTNFPKDDLPSEPAYIHITHFRQRIKIMARGYHVNVTLNQLASWWWPVGLAGRGDVLCILQDAALMMIIKYPFKIVHVHSMFSCDYRVITTSLYTWRPYFSSHESKITHTHVRHRWSTVGHRAGYASLYKEWQTYLSHLYDIKSGKHIFDTNLAFICLLN